MNEFLITIDADYSLYCESIDKTFDECGCLYDNRQTRQQMDENTLLYNDQLANLIQF